MALSPKNQKRLDAYEQAVKDGLVPFYPKRKKTKKSRQRKMVKSAWQRRLSKKPPPGITECAECGTKPKRLHEVFGAEEERWVCGECLGFLLKARRASREAVVEDEEGR